MKNKKEMLFVFQGTSCNSIEPVSIEVKNTH